VSVGRKALHVGPELGDDHLGGALTHPRDRAEQLDLALERRTRSSISAESELIVSLRYSMWASRCETSNA
jgi:hypothetical protein